MSKQPDFGTTNHKRQFQCRRCFRWKTKLFMVADNSAGYAIATNLCLECDTKDKIKQAEYAKAREQKKPATLGELIDRIGADRGQFIAALGRIDQHKENEQA